MEPIKVEIHDKKYNAYIVTSEEDKVQGLSNVESMEDNEMMIFDYSQDLQDELVFNTVDMDFPIDIIFVNDDDEVVAVEYGEPHSDNLIQCTADEGEKLKYVLEVNANSGIQIGDELDFEDEGFDDDDIEKMYILGSDGTPQMDLVGNERIVSRRETKILIKKAKKANKKKTDAEYKKLGKYIFKVFQGQDTREPEYTESPK